MAKKTQDLKITDKELENIQGKVKVIQSFEASIGRAEVSKMVMYKQMEAVQDELRALQIELEENMVKFKLIFKMVQYLKYLVKMKLIRKISIGKDYKNDAMHYSVGQEVYGGHTIEAILEEKDKYSVFITKNDEIIPWKDFNKNMAISVEYNLEY